MNRKRLSDQLNASPSAYMAKDWHSNLCTAGTSAASISLRGCNGRSDNLSDFTMADKVLRSGTEENFICADSAYACMK